MAPEPDRKRKLEELAAWVEDLEKNHDSLDGRVGRLELQHERESAYRYLRVEHAQGLTSLFKQCEDGTVERANLRVEGAISLLWKRLPRWLQKTVTRRLCRPLPSGCQRVSGDCRPAPGGWLARKAWKPSTRDCLSSLRLAGGEPSRLLSEGVRKDLNWVLYVLGKAEEVPTIQAYPDLGPATQKHEKGKSGKSSGKGGAKGGKGKLRGSNSGAAHS